MVLANKPCLVNRYLTACNESGFAVASLPCASQIVENENWRIIETVPAGGYEPEEMEVGA